MSIASRVSYRDATPLDHARALVRDEIRRAEDDREPLLSRTAWRHLGTVKILVNVDPQSVAPRSRDDLEVALEYLTVTDLVEAEVPDGAVSSTRPQTYRWARRATFETLQRFAAGRPTQVRIADDESQRCQAPGCRNERLGGRARYCSHACNQRAYKLRQATMARARREEASRG